ncbi:hypothetical protein GCM10010211_10520 [Streptomyces albospinus]|uniref:Condensation domain-containing protein n=1 Tax=Streptomyces albospinus TaxID=285515 RepID=A0ABQ2UQ07_9ACTN|nr:condensation domain-containing protein [Streptomyces albospinus]GGU48227.1 hypothetical protein GCM10010211_10520 [Streptomyces albospinus]
MAEAATGVYRPHHPSVALRIRGPLQASALARAWLRLQERHPVLLCGFDRDDFTWRLDTPAEATGITRAGPAPEATADDVLRLVERLVDAPFDFTGGPLARLVLLERPDETLFVLVLDHLVGDFWSLDLLMTDLTTFYVDELGLPTEPLPPVALTYPEQVREQNAYLDSPDGLRALLRVSDSLKAVGPVPETRFAGFSGAASARYDHTGLVRATIAGELRKAVFACARAFRTSPWTLMHAAVHRALYRLSDQSAIGTTLMTANRESSSVHQTVGFLAGKVVVATDRDAGATTAEFLRGFQRAMLHALDHTAIPWPRLIAHMEPSLLGRHATVPYIGFNPQNATMRRWLGGWRFPGCEAAPLELAGSTPDAAIVISLTEGEDGISVSLFHKTDWYTADAVETFWRTTEHTLREWAHEAGVGDQVP